MNAANWIGVGLIVAAVGGGVYYVVRSRTLQVGGNATLAGGPVQSTTPAGQVAAPPAQPSGVNEAKAWLGVAKEGINTFKDLFSTIEEIAA